MTLLQGVAVMSAIAYQVTHGVARIQGGLFVHELLVRDVSSFVF